MSNALQERNRMVKYAKELGIDKPHKLKNPELEKAIDEAETAQLPTPEDIEKERKYNILLGKPTVIIDENQEDDPFDPIDPEIEGDHLEAPLDDYYHSVSVEHTREGWLTRAVDALRPLLKQHGATVPERVAVSVGYADRKASKTNGVCYKAVASDCKTTNHIFVSPKLKEAWRVLLTLNHELIHASDDCASGHGGHFAKVARAMGYINKLTSSEASPELQQLLTEIAEELGEYPHTGLNTSGDSSAGKKQTTRLLKMVCTNSECGLSVRITRTWLEKYNTEIDEGWGCPCGSGELMEG